MRSRTEEEYKGTKEADAMDEGKREGRRCKPKKGNIGSS
jgi:hypothetical protein